VVAVSFSHPSIVGTAPEILVAAIAATTGRIRVGSAGVLLPHYAPLKVAEQFRVIEAIAPGRIDLGVGRAPGSDGRTAFALNPNAAAAAEQFPAQLRDLLAWVSGEALPDGHPFRDVEAHPLGPTAPEIWVLGSSDYGAQVAALFGLPYCFAHFITDGRGAGAALSLYRRLYRPSARHPEPRAALCVWALAAETDAEARRLFASRALWRSLRERGVLVPLPPPEEALPPAPSALDPQRLDEMSGRALVGTPDRVRDRLEGLAQELEADELVILTWAHDPVARLRSYRLLAGAFGLGPPADAPSAPV
jgi:luciferase family oxidoreductase group 1